MEVYRYIIRESFYCLLFAHPSLFSFAEIPEYCRRREK